MKPHQQKITVQFKGKTVSRKYFAALFFSLFVYLNISTEHLFAQVTVTGSTGADAIYPSLTQAGGAFAAINAAGSQAGNNIVLTISANVLTEDGTNSLNAKDWTSLAILPGGGAARTVSGNFIGPLIDLNGADNVIIDGLNTGGNSLTITNTATGASSTLRFIADATNNIVRNANLKGSTTSLGVVLFSTGISTGNDGNNINNCNINAAGANLPINGVYSLGSSVTVDNSGNTINANNISDYFNATITSAGISLQSVGNKAWTITNNRLFQTATRTYTAAITTLSAISVQIGDGYTITGNTIGFANATGTGTTNMIGSVSLVISGTFPSSYTTTGTPAAIRYSAINCTFDPQGTASSIQNNRIAGFAFYTASGVTTGSGIFCGIHVFTGNANIGTITGNTIGSTTGTGSIYVVTTTLGGAFVGIRAISNDVINIENNTIGAIDAMGASASICGGITGINADVQLAGLGGSSNVSGNTIGNATNPNLRMGNLMVGGAAAGPLSNTGSFITTSGGASFIGILNGAVTAVQLEPGTIGTAIKPNVIRNAFLFSTSAAALMRGILSNSSSNVTISSNTITNFNSRSVNTGLAGAAQAINGILVTNGFVQLAAATVADNTISNLALQNTTAVLNHSVGISCTNMSTVNITRNKICDLSNSSTGVGIANTSTSPSVSGIVVRVMGTAAGQAVSHVVSNNMISLGAGQTTNTQFFGIWQNFTNQTAGLAVQLTAIHNTINISGTVAGAGASPSCGILRRNFTVATNNLTPMSILNNVIVNNRTGGTGKHYTIANDLGLATSINTGWGAGASNYNVLNAASAATVGYWSTDQTFAGWQAASAGDVNSYTGVPITFVSNCDLHINMGTTPTALESNGVTGTGVLVDIDNQTRPGPASPVNGGSYAPDLGADEFDGKPGSPKFNTVTIDRSTCIATAHNVTADISPNAASTTSVILNYNNGAPGSVAMTNSSGNIWTGQILVASPANAIVTWSITATNSDGISVIYNGVSYQDEATFVAIASPSAPIDAFGFTNLNVNPSNPIAPGDVVTYSWSPSIGLSNPNIKNPVFTPQAGGTTIFTVTVTNTSIPCTTTANVTVIANPAPGIPSCSGDTVCGQGVVTLSATGTGVLDGDSLIWTNNFGGLVLKTEHSPSFYSTFVDTSGSAYVREIPSTITTATVGYNGFDPASAGAGYFPTSEQGMWFRVFGTSSGALIKSVDIISANPVGSTYLFSIEDTLGNIIGQVSGVTTRTNVGTAGPFNIETIPMNIFVPYSPHAYKIRPIINPQMLVFQNATVGGTSPWLIANYFQILGYGDLGPSPATTSLFGPTTFGFFFNWKVSYGAFGAPCQAVYIVETVPPATLIATDTVTTCGPGNNTLIAGGDPSWVNFNWSPATGLNTTSGDTVIATPVVTTTYTVTFDDGLPNGCSTTKTITLTVLVPPFVDAGSTTFDTLCISTPPFQLNGSGGSATFKQIGFNESPSQVSGGIFNGANLSQRSQMHFSKAELNSGGMFGPGFISGIGFNVASKTSTQPYSNFTVKMDVTAPGCFASTTNQTLAFTNFAGSYSTHVGWNDIVFTAPYAWDGVSDVIVEVCFTNATTTGIGFDLVYYTPTAGCNTMRSTNASSCSDIAGALSVERPNVRFTGGPVFYTWSPATDLSSTSIANPVFTPTTQGPKKYYLSVLDPSTNCVRMDSIEFVIDDTPKVPSASIQGCVAGETYLVVCDSGSATLVTEQRDATFQWQRSTNNINFADIPGANAATYNTPMVFSDTYYRVKVICIDSAFSNSITLDVINAQLLSSQGDTICGPGVANLSAVASPGEFVQWYSDSTSTTVLYSGGNYATEFLVQTDTLWATSATDTAELNWAGGAIIINDNDTASPYPSSITVSGLPPLTRLKGVLINGLEHTFPADVAIVLESPANDFAILMNGDGGGTPIVGVDLILENCAPALPSPLISGTFSPTNPLNFTDSLNGLWELYVEDFFATDFGAITSWGLVFERTICSAPRVPVVAVVTPPPGLSATTLDNALCEGESTTLNITVGEPAYQTFLWSPAAGLDQTTGNSVVASPSTTTSYVVHAIDNGINQCNNYDTLTIDVTPIPALSIVSSTTTACGGFVSNLSAISTGAITYLWTPSTGLNDPNIANPAATVASGTSIEYHILVTDNLSGCTNNDSITLTAYNNPTPIIYPGDSLICQGTSFYQKVKDIGAFSGGYPVGTTVDWVGIVNGLSPDDSVNTSGISDFSVIVHLPVVIGGCTATSPVVHITTHQLDIIPTITPSTCSNSNGKIIINVVGTAPYHYTWSDGINTIRDIQTSNTSDSITGLASGNYYLTVIDNEGNVNPGLSCNSGQLSYFVVSNGGPVASISAQSDVHCTGGNDGSATVSQTGGIGIISYEWFPYGGNLSTSDPLGAGSFFVVVTDGNGCVDTADVVIGEPDSLLVSANAFNATCDSSDGVGIVTVQGGRAPYTYIWYNASFDDMLVYNDTISILAAGTYYVVVGDSAGYCFTIDTIEVSQTCEVALNLNAFIEGYYIGGGAMQPVMSNAAAAIGNTYPNVTDCDTITVELHDQLNPAVIVPGGLSQAMLQVDGTAEVLYPGTIQGGSYWIVVKNRTMVETWSSQPVTFTGLATSYNFTTIDTMAYSSNMREIEPGYWVMYSGDIDDGSFTPFQDGFVDIFDYLIMDVDIQSGNAGYYVTDLNGDGFIDIFDFLVLDPNIQTGVSKLTPP